jgi:GT2 family glycosyltransferase
MKNDSTIAVSVIIPTFNRYPIVIDTVKSLIPQLNSGDEIIIVDQSEPGIAAQIKSEVYALQNTVYIYLKTPSLPNARNVGIENAKGEVIAFIDDDIIPSENLLKQHLLSFEKHSSIGCVAGRVIEQFHPLVYKKPRIYVNCWGRVYRDINSEKEAYTRSAPGGNMSFLKKAVETTGKFDCYYAGSATLEETDYAYRLQKNGYKILFNPLASLVHLSAPSGGCRVNDSLQKEFFNIRNTTRFMLKNRPLFHFPLFCIYSLVQFIWRMRKANKNISGIAIICHWCKSVLEGIKSFKYEKL